MALAESVYHGNVPSRFVKVPISPSAFIVASLHALIASSSGSSFLPEIGPAKFVARRSGQQILTLNPFFSCLTAYIDFNILSADFEALYDT